MNKDVVIIVSGGRTGTQFFGDLLLEMVEDSYSVHEPDLFAGFNRQTWQRLKIFGMYHMLIGRLLGRTGMRNLSQKYLSGALDLDGLAREIRQHRFDYYGSLTPSLIIESYSQWYGVLPSLPRVFPSYKVVGIIRDARTWVTSNTNKGTQYGSRDSVTKLGLRRMDPQMVGDRQYQKRWPSMSAFERLCWHWKTINEMILEFVENDTNSKMYRYENLFLEPSHDEDFRDLLDFLTDFPKRKYCYNFDTAVLRKPINFANRERFPDWSEWDSTLARQLDSICGPLMKRFDYGNESTWHDLLRG